MVILAERQPGNLNSSPLGNLQSPRMTVPESLVKRKIKIKIVSKGNRVESAKDSSKYGADVITQDECITNSSVHGKMSDRNISLKLPAQSHSKKRGPVAVLDGPGEKRRKMDRSVKQQCANILKYLRTHKFGWPFIHPVDPVALNIPDYFSIVKYPMDLGTIKSKLEKNDYFSMDEFAADVRLTFSNSMLYNPPHYSIHTMAKTLKNIFERKWKLLENKVKCGRTDVLQQYMVYGNGEDTQGTLQMQHEISPPNVNAANRKAMSLEEKQKMRKELKELLRGKMTENLLNILRKFNLRSLKGIDKYLDSIDEDILWELKRMVKSSLNTTVEKPAKSTQSVHQSLSAEVFNKGTDCGSKASCESGDVKPPASSAKLRCNVCDSSTCRCSLGRSDFQLCSSLTMESVTEQGLDGVSRAGSSLENFAASCMRRLDAESNGAGIIAEVTACLSPDLSDCGSTDMPDEGSNPVVDVQLSPRKALRVAMLKSRFADTIFKAKNRTLLDHGDKADPVKLQQERERLDKQHRQEKARIEAQIVAAEAASRLRAQELKMQREREREAARVALQQMEKTVEFDDNLKFLRDLEMISRASQSECPFGDLLGNPLERLGLYRKDDYPEDDEEAILSEGGSEDGEILS